MQKSNLYYAFVDGSAHRKRERYGIGGIIYTSADSNQKDISFSQALGKKNTSVTAELRAAAHALNLIPPKSHVVLHSDFKTLTDKIERDSLLVWRRRTARSDLLKGAYTELFNAVSRHASVRAVHVYEKKNPFIAIAHKLANVGAKGQTDELREEIRKAKKSIVEGTKQKKNKRPSRREINISAIVESLASFGLTLDDVP